MSVVFDTGSDWMVIQGSSCTNCEGTLFNATKSGTLASSTLQVRTYGSANLTGYVYNDTFCLSKDMSSCILNFQYFSVVNQVGLRPPVEGIAGMS